MKAKRSKHMGPVRILWYCVLVFLILGYIVVPFFYTFRQALVTDTGYGLDVFL